MQIKNLFLLTCLLATALLRANTTPETIILPLFTNVDDGPCDIPPPANFHIEDVGTSYIKYAWTNLTTYAHRVRTYRASDNLLLSTVIAPSGANTAMAINLPSGTPCYGVVNAIGTNGCNSPYEGTSETRSTLIIELVVDGNSIQSGSSTCNIVGSGKCQISNTAGVITPFKISKIGSSEHRMFGATRNPGGNGHTYKATLETNNDGTGFEFKCNGEDPDPQCSGPIVIEIKFIENGNPTDVGTITVGQEGIVVQSYLYFNPSSQNFRIDRTDGNGELPTNPSKGYIRARDGNAPTSNQIASASPNPFSETLDVFLTDPSAENIQLQMFNLSGQQVLQKQFAGGQGQYTLSTHGLSPGFYMLRIEADGAVQTLKVVKSE